MDARPKKALIIRSASFQQLDKNLPEILKNLSEYQFDLLTHEHGVRLAEKYAQIDKIFIYPYRASFHRKSRVKELEKESYDAVIVLVTNLTGAGFLNVIQYATTIRSREYLLCNLVSRLTPFTRRIVAIDQFKSSVLKLIAALGTIVMAPLFLIGLLIGMPVIRIKK
jgi:ADP-heptose:LPS heptosyltransferase